MSEKKVVGRRIAIALGITCIILAVGLIGAFALLKQTSTTDSSPNSQNSLQGWTEGNSYFNLTGGQDVNFTISTAGFSSVTITIDAWSSTPVSGGTLGAGHGFQVFIGFITANTTVDYQVYDVQSYAYNPPPPPTPVGFIWPPWSYFSGYLHWPASFRQTYEVTFSKIMVWIWNNCTLLSTSTPVWGNVYSYLTA
jgi:hypothetical protein